MEAEQALSALYTRYHRPLTAYLFGLVHDWHLAEDLCHDAFLRAWPYWRGTRPPQEAQAWLYRVATNLAYDHLRQQRRRPHALSYDDSALEAASDAPAQLVETRDLARRLLAQIAQSDAALLVAQAVHDYTIREIAAQLGWPEGTVKSRISRARARLRRRADRST